MTLGLLREPCTFKRPAATRSTLVVVPGVTAWLAVELVSSRSLGAVLVDGLAAVVDVELCSLVVLDGSLDGKGCPGRLTPKSLMLAVPVFLSLDTTIPVSIIESTQVIGARVCLLLKKLKILKS